MGRVVARRLTVGAELQRDGGAHVRVWAPQAAQAVLVIPDGPDRPGGAAIVMEKEADGHFSAFDEEARAGGRYWFRLGDERLRPDPASRYQPEGPHQPSAYVDPHAFAWTDQQWKGLTPVGQVVYEMHVGTFTREGTWAAAAEQLDELARIGITVIEMMPVAEFPGRFGWGYDGVDLFAPAHLYGTPDDLRAFVNRAHAAGVAVILDVVYNHLGPDGNYLEDFSRDYFTDKYKNDWGRSINFEGPLPARSFFVENAGYWIDEFHFDGLRFDATQDIKDASNEHVITSMARRARDAAGKKSVYLIAENEPQDTRLVRPVADNGSGLDALWNDDFHHTAVVALTGRREAYYTDYKGSVQELISAAKYGYLYQGQWYEWQKKPRGTPALDLPPQAFVAYLENHDQVANSIHGRRLHQLSSPGRYRALTALTLLGPATPLLFQGQEFAASAPFLFFADHRAELRESIRSGRREFLSQFISVRDPEVTTVLDSPVDEATFSKCKLDLEERRSHATAYALHRDLLHLRASHLAFSQPRRVDGAALVSEVLLLRYFGEHDEFALIVNLGCDLDLAPAPEPLLAPPRGARWTVWWSSESVKYGGGGTPRLNARAVPHLIGESAVLLRAVSQDADDHGID